MRRGEEGTTVTTGEEGKGRVKKGVREDKRVKMEEEV